MLKPNDARELALTSPATGAEKAVLLAVILFAHPAERVCTASTSTIARAAGRDRRTTQRALGSLARAGGLEVLAAGGGRGHTTIYRVPEPPAELAPADADGQLHWPHRNGGTTPPFTAAERAGERAGDQAVKGGTTPPEVNGKGLKAPPSPPRGERKRDRDRFDQELNTWAALHGLPRGGRLGTDPVRQAVVEAGARSLDEVLAHLDRWFDWRPEAAA